MWFLVVLAFVLLAAVGLVTFDLLAHYWAGRFATWTDLRHHLLYLVGLRKSDRPLHTLPGNRGTEGKLVRPGSSKAVSPDRRAAGGECYGPGGQQN